MLFVDGENLTIQAAEFAKLQNKQLVEGPHYKQAEFVWLPKKGALERIYRSAHDLEMMAVRAHYYTSVCGDDVAVADVRQRLWSLGFTPLVIKKAKKQRKAKGVDIALTKDLLSHAFMGNYDVAVLIAGDADYVPVVEEVKRLGKRVIVSFFEGSSLGLELRLAGDEFYDISSAFATAWA
jgi:uncharacterized LabA/DUF88 family protein